MKNALLSLIAVLLSMMPLAAGAFPGKDPKGGDCTKCHKLEKKDAEEMLKKFVPNGNVGEVKMAPVKGFWQIDFLAGQQRGVVFLDFSKKYVAQMATVEYLEQQVKAPRKSAET